MTDSVEWQELSTAAWAAREHSRVHGSTRVGAAVLSRQGKIYAGCNVEHRFRSHDVHAEVNALTTMATAGDGPAIAVLIVSPRKMFTPCGGCLDWIFELGGPACIVAFQSDYEGAVKVFRADELMPHYPH
ncbi:hypothetical protein [Gordonia sp. NPDC003585]|uniref:cytidine deaminase family protein n=1 Tax=Gordonia sp. NPDC003585 TaxID=3154275 RepID=UPI00339FD2A4